ncbi:uncharacterized protein LOC144143080 [Haemaphysalis longicornis]
MRDRSAIVSEDQDTANALVPPALWPHAVTWQPDMQPTTSVPLPQGNSAHSDRVSCASTMAQAGSEYRPLTSTSDSAQGSSQGTTTISNPGTETSASCRDTNEAACTDCCQERCLEERRGSQAGKVNRGAEARPPPAGPPARKSDGGYLSVAVLCAVVTLPVLLLGVGLKLVTMRTGAQRSALAFVGISDVLLDQCSNDNDSAPCKEILDRMAHSMKATADPCDDFYESVCGNWEPRYANRPSYFEEHVESFNRRVHEALLNTALRSPSSMEERALATHQMAVFYSSCHSLASGRDLGGTASDVFRALGINPDSWLKAPSLGGLLNLVVHAAQETGLSSFVSVTIKNDVLHVEVGETLLSSLRSLAKVNQLLLLTLSALNLNFSAHFSELHEVDSDVNRIIASFGRKWQSSPYRQSTVAKLRNFLPEVDWHQMLTRGRSSRLVRMTSESMVNFRGEIVLNTVIGRLHLASVPTVAVYAMSVLLAQVMKYSLLLREVFVPDRFNDIHWCLRMTGSHFGALYQSWLAGTFYNRSAVTRVRRLFADIRVLLMRDNRVNRGVLVDNRRLKRTQLTIYGESNVLSARLPPLPHRLNATFLPNLATVLQSRVGQDAAQDERVADLLTSGYLGYQRNESEDVFVVAPAYLSAHGLLALRFDELDVLYPTVAVLVLRAIFDEGAYHSPAGLANYTDECFSESVSFALGKHVPPNAVRPFMGSRWAAQYSSFLSKHKAGTKASRRHLDDKGRSHLFFRLGCFVSCGDPTLRDACNDVAYSTDEFALALDCKRERKVQCKCERVDNCATYVLHE